MYYEIYLVSYLVFTILIYESAILSIGVVLNFLEECSWPFVNNDHVAAIKILWNQKLQIWHRLLSKLEMFELKTNSKQIHKLHLGLFTREADGRG